MIQKIPFLQTLMVQLLCKQEYHLFRKGNAFYCEAEKMKHKT